jgi:GT2 family glycosyltransferase
VTPPHFSVLVPTRNRADLAGGCVRALLRQDHSAFEVLVLDQSEGGDTARAVAAADDGSGRLRRIPVDGVGRSRALNAGIPHARGAWVVLVDDDCEPLPGWLRSLDAESRQAGPRSAIVGRVLPGAPEPGLAPPPATLDEPEPADYAGRVRRDLVYPNFAVPREAFAEVGVFDERMGVGTPLPGGEDNDFGYRLLRAGWRILYRPGPAVIHRAWRTHAARLALKRAYGLGQGAFYAKHLARLDLFMTLRLVEDLGGTARAAAGAAVRGRWSESGGHLRFLEGMVEGAARMAVLLVRGAGRPR